MREGGREAPRRKVGVGGFLVKRAQSRGEWPGSSKTFLEGRRGVGRVEVERRGGWDLVVGVGRVVEVGRDKGGWRRVVGGRVDEEGVGGGFRRVCAEAGGDRDDDDDGRGGGGIRVLVSGATVSGFRFALGAGRAGEGTDKPVCKSDPGGCESRGDGDCFGCDTGSGVFSDPTSYGIPPALATPLSDVRAKDGSEE